MRYVGVSGIILGLIVVGLLVTFSAQILLSAAPPTVDTATAAATSGGSETALNLVESSTTVLYVHGVISDTDGCEDVATNGTVTGKFYRTNHASGDGCTADNNDCYTIVNANCTKAGCTGPGDNSFNYECTAQIQYYADSTTTGPYVASDWTAKITATDAAQTSGSNNDGIEMNTTIAHNVAPTLGYGSIGLGQESAEQVFSIENSGNSGIDIEFSVNGDMTCETSTVPAGNARYSGISGFDYASGTPLSPTATEFELNLAPRSNDAMPSSQPAFFKLKMPDSGIAGACSNTLTSVSKVDTEGGW